MSNIENMESVKEVKRRNSGILLHISSLPSNYGIGTLGKEAYSFVDFLEETGQKYWQILPLGHTSYGDSPYQSFSAFAGNPYFIDLDFLVTDGHLSENDLQGIDFGYDETRVDYEKMFYERYRVLRKAYASVKNKSSEKIDKFAQQNAFWLDDYALYMSVKEKMGLVQWQDWDEDIKLRKKEAVKHYQETLSEDINFWKFIQYEFYRQWKHLKNYANRKGIEIIGDIPIYVASDSSDTWANSEIFELDENKAPINVAGCPPDAFSETGQLWGNPLYNWDYLDKTNYAWWISRMRESLKLYDMIRIDHFRGFEAYWSIPADEETAINGKWVKGPSMKIFDAIKRELGDVKIIAEDLGYLTQEVLDLRDNTGYPGMKVLQFAFDMREESDYIPHTYDKYCVVYTGTHDNDTIVGWMETSGNKEDVASSIEYLRLTKEEGYNWGFIRGAWSSVGDTAITTMQDLLNLGADARMNIPSTLGCNWIWRMKKTDVTDCLKAKLHNLTKLYGREN